MTFLAPWMIVVAAAVTIPPLVALYFLKLRRQQAPISSTLLWKRAVQDLHVNAPFQRLRKNLLLLLQLLILILAAFALGKPMWARSLARESTLVVLVDQSASMGVIEDDGRSRLELAKEQAKAVIDGMPEDARAMVIAFCDRATVVSSFDTDRESLKRKIDSIEQTQSTSTLGEAVALAEAYSQRLVIGGTEAGADIAPTSAAPPATAVIFTDGRIGDSAEVTVQNLDVNKIEVVSVGQRDDNAGIVAMAARRNYEHPELIEVFATVRNFGQTSLPVDVDLRIRDAGGFSHHLGSGSKTLAPGRLEAPAEDETTEPAGDEPPPATGDPKAGPPVDSIYSVAFKREWEGGGVVEVRLSVEDALEADNRAWVVIPPPRHVRTLLVTEGNYPLEQSLAVLPIQAETMTPAEYETVDLDALADGDRSRYDVVILDRHSTARLPQGSYFFWGAAPQIDGVALGERIEDEVIVNWDESHAILRYVAVDSIWAWAWNRLTVPSDARVLMEGESSPVMCQFSRNGSNFLLCAFPIIINDEITGEPVENTRWYTKSHFVMFMANTVQYLAASVSAGGRRSVYPGEPVTLPIEAGQRRLRINRPDGQTDEIPAAKAAFASYARTRQVGVYTVRGAAEGEETFAVNLFSPLESDVAPAQTLAIGAAKVAVAGQVERINRPFWPWLLGGILAVLILEWIVYNKRVFV